MMLHHPSILASIAGVNSASISNMQRNRERTRKLFNRVSPVGSWRRRALKRAIPKEAQGAILFFEIVTQSSCPLSLFDISYALFKISDFCISETRC